LKKNKNKKTYTKKQRVLLFVKIFALTTLILLALVLAGWIVLQNTVYKPPTPPDITAPADDHNEPDGFHKDDLISEGDGDGDDAQVGGGLKAPEGFTNEDRKELFYTFLLFGLDGGVSTDTIMVASYDGVNMEANVVSFPRDTLVNVSRRVKKINAAYAAGSVRGGMEGGIAQLKREIKTIIGFEPDYYICVDFMAFVRVIDAIGGIEVDVPFDMYYRDPAQNLTIDIKKGENVWLNGEQALHFARYRRGSNGSRTISDYERIKNQQTVMKAALERLLRPANILQIPEFIAIFNEYVSTDIKPAEILWFADQANKIGGVGALHTYTIPIRGSSGEPDFYEFLDEKGVLDMVNATINPFRIDIERKDIDIAK
jgi:LCP family protein required for cell wall assembly